MSHWNKRPTYLDREARDSKRFKYLHYDLIHGGAPPEGGPTDFGILMDEAGVDENRPPLFRGYGSFNQMDEGGIFAVQQFERQFINDVFGDSNTMRVQRPDLARIHGFFNLHKTKWFQDQMKKEWANAMEEKKQGNNNRLNMLNDAQVWLDNARGRDFKLNPMEAEQQWEQNHVPFFVDTMNQSEAFGDGL